MRLRYTWGMHQYLRRLWRRHKRAHTIDVTITVDTTEFDRAMRYVADASLPTAYDDRPADDGDMPGWSGLDEIADS